MDFGTAFMLFTGVLRYTGREIIEDFPRQLVVERVLFTGDGPCSNCKQIINFKWPENCPSMNCCYCGAEFNIQQAVDICKNHNPQNNTEENVGCSQYSPIKEYLNPKQTKIHIVGFRKA